MSIKQVRRTIRYILHQQFRPGASKHSAKRAGDKSRLIYSYRTLFAFLDVVNVLFSWLLQQNFPIYSPTDISVEIVILFLDAKATSCTQTTVDWYRSMLAGLGNRIRAYYCLQSYDLHVPRVYAAKKTSGLRGAAAKMPRTEYNIILGYCREHPSGSAYAVLLEEYLAGRVTDICERMCVFDGMVQMTCKGGKPLFRVITPAMADLLKDPRFAAWRREKGSFSLPRSRTVNQFLRRLEKRLDLPFYSFHAIRRLLAQEHYDELRRIGIERNRALAQTGLWLNHGPKRQQLVLKSYVNNPW